METLNEGIASQLEEIRSEMQTRIADVVASAGTEMREIEGSVAE